MSSTNRPVRFWHFVLYEVPKSSFQRIKGAEVPSDFGIELARQDTFYTVEKEMIRIAKDTQENILKQYTWCLFMEHKKSGEAKYIEHIWLDEETNQLVID